ncbi:oligosaccharide flippase family protein [Clostridium baratii]|uniref:lipopolysaccharide biosynthesis protein n=1 Tax=Clostridium baratii TaxID=1561 RepID=UPI001C00CCF4|nr:oligosaccharide flippase family protein [Clostridium baratii]MBT9830485.1 oligosaccharide flippase family protein [Clostridium baratii]
MDNKLFKKFIEFGIGNFIVLITGFISSPIITRLILPEEFGKFSMFNTLASLFIFILILGLDQSYIRFFYEEDEELRSKLLIETVKLPIIINLLLSSILMVFYKPISNLIIGEYSIVLVLILILQNTFNILNKFSVLVVRMQQKGKTYSFLQVLGRVSYILLIIMTFKIFKHDYRTLVFAAVLSNVAVVVIAIYVERKEWFKFNKSRKNLNTSRNEMIKFGLPLVFSMSITWVFQSIDKFFVNSYNGYLELGVYSAAFTIVAILVSVQESFITFWVPIANEKYKEDSNNKEFFTKMNGIVSVVMMIIGVGVILCKDIIVVLLGEKYRGASFIFPMLILMPIMFTISETTVIGINFKKKTKYHLITSIIAASTNFIGNMILVPSLGSKGAAISTGFSYLIFFTARTVISKSLYKVNYNLPSLYISIISLIILALYASFNKVNSLLIILSIITLIIITISYKFVFIELIKKIKEVKVGVVQNEDINVG